MGEALLAVERAKKTGLPAMVTICFENKDETAEGKSAADAAKTLFDAGADIVGMNCLRPPEHILGPMEQMRKAVSGYLACQPVAYRTPKDKPDFTSLPEFPYALDPFNLPARKWRTMRCRLAILGSTSSVPVVGRLPCTFERWRAC